MARDSSVTAQVCTWFYWVRSWSCRHLSPQNAHSAQEQQWMLARFGPHLLWEHITPSSGHTFIPVTSQTRSLQVKTKSQHPCPEAAAFLVIHPHTSRAHPVCWAQHEPETKSSLDFPTVKLNSDLFKLLFPNEASRMTLYEIHYAFEQLGRGHLAAIPSSQEEWQFSSNKQSI